MRLHCLHRPKGESYAQRVYETWGHVSIHEADIILVLGGDGFMLHTLHRYQHLKKPFYGINFGSHGALMNGVPEISTLMEHIKKAHSISVSPLTFSITTLSGETVHGWAFNEITLQRASYRSIKWSFTLNDILMIDKGCGDGIIVSTSLGSSAYNSAAGGPFIHQDIAALAITPLNMFYPKGLGTLLVPHQSRIDICIQEADHRLVSLGADVFQYDSPIHKCAIQRDTSRCVSLLFQTPPFFKYSMSSEMAFLNKS